MSNFFTTILNFIESEALSVWSKVSGAFNTILNEVPDDEIAIINGAIGVFTAALKAGKSWGEAAADTWTYVDNQEGAELSKVGNLLLQAFLEQFAPGAN